jgi:hypothetical protein
MSLTDSIGATPERELNSDGRFRARGIDQKRQARYDRIASVWEVLEDRGYLEREHRLAGEKFERHLLGSIYNLPFGAGFGDPESSTSEFARTLNAGEVRRARSVLDREQYSVMESASCESMSLAEIGRRINPRLKCDKVARATASTVAREACKRLLELWRHELDFRQRDP